MRDRLLREGGPHNTRRTGKDTYRMSIDIPVDDDGMIGRECVSDDCSPGYYKVRPGTGITEDHAEAFCPYCRSTGDPNDFATSAQIEYAQAIVLKEAQKGVDRIIRKTFGFGASRKKKLGGGLVSLEMTYKPSRIKPVPHPAEEELRRDITCPSCGLDHAVFGLATWCPDCGQDMFIVHIRKEFDVVRRAIAAVDERRQLLGHRLAARDIENALEDIVSLFEAVMKAITRRHLVASGASEEEAKQIVAKKIGNRYQSVRSSGTVFEEHVGNPLFDGFSQRDLEWLEAAFEKRHPITHNLGIVDRKYLERALSGELEGREIRLSEEEVLQTLEIALAVVVSAYERAFPHSKS